MAEISQQARTTELTYEPVACPGLPIEACEALKVWGAAWQDWGTGVVEWVNWLAATGPAATGVAPVPPPPPPRRPLFDPPRPPFALNVEFRK